MITELLAAAGRGDRTSHDRLWALIYDELHALAQRQLAGDTVGRVRQPTSLLHEAYLRLTAAWTVACGPAGNLVLFGRRVSRASGIVEAAS